LQDTYRTIQSASEGLYKEKGSKFFAFAYPVSAQSDIDRHLEFLKQKYHDARHHCYAYVIGINGAEFRANDDGEPNHSAGDPILGQIRSFDLTNTLIIVVRYFGGTKLGVPGLIQAYRTAAKMALEHCVIIQKVITQSFQVIYAYEDTSAVMKLVDDFALEVEAQEFTEVCKMKLAVRKSLTAEVTARLSRLSVNFYEC